MEKLVTVNTDNKTYNFSLKENENYDVLLGKIILNFTVNTPLPANKIRNFNNLLHNYIFPSIIRQSK